MRRQPCCLFCLGVLLSPYILLMILKTYPQYFLLLGQTRNVGGGSRTPKIDLLSITNYALEDMPILEDSKKYLILMWTRFYSSTDLSAQFRLHNVLPDWCEVTFDKSRLNNSHAVVFHIPGSELNFNDLPRSRTPDQVWTFLSIEPAAYHPSSSNFQRINDMQFNRTMTYRLDSDYPIPYGYPVIKNESVGELPPQLLSLVQHRTKPIAWMVSHCGVSSGRETLARELAKHIPVDIYGTCGTLHCPRDTETAEEACYATLARKYKFYLSFENSLCKDYITEKFSNAISYFMVPIVYGAGNYSKIFPYPHSFIHYKDFQNVKALADYILYLDGNMTAYMEYFEWTRYLHMRIRRGFEAWGRVCRSLAKGDLQRSESYPDLMSWWRQCKGGSDFVL